MVHYSTLGGRVICKLCTEGVRIDHPSQHRPWGSVRYQRLVVVRSHLDTDKKGYSPHGANSTSRSTSACGRSMTGSARSDDSMGRQPRSMPRRYATHRSEASPAARNTLDSARIPRASKLLICGLFQKGRVLAQDGIDFLRSTGHPRGLESRPGLPRHRGPARSPSVDMDGRIQSQHLHFRWTETDLNYRRVVEPGRFRLL